MQAHTVPGSLYPLLVVKGKIPDQFFEILDGVTHRKQEYEGNEYHYFPIWHIERLSRYFGPPDNDLGKQLHKSITDQQAQIDLVKDGSHPLIKQAPAYFYEHQKKAWALGIICRTYGFFLEQGLGKTAIVIEIMRIPSRRVPTLIICPPTLIRGTWMPELDHWAPELTYANLQEQPELATRHFDVYLLNREKLARNAPFYEQTLRHRIGRVIIDESSMMKNAEAKTTEGIISAFGTVPERYLLSGTPAPNGPHEYWSQIHFLRPGLLPFTYDEFMKGYFVQKYRDKYAIKDGSMEIVMDRISSCSISMTKKDCLDLPEKRYIVRPVVLPENTRKAYIQLREKLRQEIFELKERGHQSGGMFAQIMKLREITSGFIVTNYYEPGVDKATGLPTQIKKSKWNFVSDHKFQVLADLLEEIGNQQVVIWMQFVRDFHELHRLFPKLHGKIGYLYGEVSPQGDTRSKIIDDFKTGKLQYLACNPASVGHGITLINPVNPCSKAIYFDLDYSLEKYEQSQDRLHRIGQKFAVDYFAILAQDTIDETIWERLQYKKGVLSDAMGYLK